MSVFHLRTRTLSPQVVAHSHRHHQLILATSGETELSLEGQGERITRARGCLIPATCHHEYQGDGRNRTLVVDIPLSHLDSLSCADEVRRLFDRPRFFAVPDSLQSLTNGLVPQIDMQPGLHGDIGTLLFRSLYLALYDQSIAPVSSCERRIHKERLDDYIDSHRDEPIEVETLASLCALSPGHFHTRFRDLFGMTPMAYVQQRRLAHAARLIQDSRLPLGDIAQRVGFHDQGSFSRAYRRAYGKAPSVHRRQTFIEQRDD
ncbi:helix-turn-helix transcriptional regulator [Aidingimonas halophila]|uniref:Transcriptional regulator, AraC family n=1 Tax=Aidingimonas halophila TaxID=574349 RepID=A0A1H3A792_9GAMM|nr:AraC family transcriptional regulator [Aidingimonas halophila]GHC21639.1 AraC family transcriptional regulator [Aidingimonas halophila]SDX25044.1 transcriptional regulator, AraC family [Aidingimonas halophila]